MSFRDGNWEGGTISLELDFRPVLRFDGKSLMGTGRARLLREIRETASLTTAAKRMGMSYRHAWGTIQHMEEIFGHEIAISERGGSGRGRTILTEAGERLLAEFENKYEMLSRAYERQFKKPSLAADGILIMDGKIVLIRRKHDPFRGKYALPGGFVEYEERVEDCIVREFKEETGLETEIESLLGVYSDPNRDPRGHTVSVVFKLALIRGKPRDSDETVVKLFSIDRIPPLAFDHDIVISDFMNRTKRASR